MSKFGPQIGSMAMSFEISQNGFKKLIKPFHTSTNPENFTNIGLADSEIIWPTGRPFKLKKKRT